MPGKLTHFAKYVTKGAVKHNPVSELVGAMADVARAATEYMIIAEQQQTQRERIRANRDVVVNKIRTEGEQAVQRFKNYNAEQATIFAAQLSLIETALVQDKTSVLAELLSGLSSAMNTHLDADINQIICDYRDKEKIIEI